MSSVTYSIHEFQRRTREYAITSMILEDQGITSYAYCFTQKYHGIGRVMKNIIEHYDVKIAITVRDYLSIKFCNRNFCIRSQENIDSLDLDVTTFLHD